MAPQTHYVITTLFILVIIVLIAALFSLAQDKKASENFAEIVTAPGQTIVVVRDARGADQAIVTTFYQQSVKGFEKPIMRSITSVIPVIVGSAVSADGAPDPQSVQMVHVSLVSVTSRMEWKPMTQGANPQDPIKQTP